MAHDLGRLRAWRALIVRLLLILSLLTFARIHKLLIVCLLRSS